jgi:hypothetical protein
MEKVRTLPSLENVKEVYILRDETTSTNIFSINPEEETLGHSLDL